MKLLIIVSSSPPRVSPLPWLPSDQICRWHCACYDARDSQLEQLKNLLPHITVYTGLRVNFEKSAMFSINTSPEKMQILANNLVCIIGSFAFTYLGLTLSLTKPKFEDFVPALKRINRRLVGCSTFSLMVTSSLPLSQLFSLRTSLNSDWRWPWSLAMLGFPSNALTGSERSILASHMGLALEAGLVALHRQRHLSESLISALQSRP